MLPALEHALNVFRHNFPHALNFSLRRLQRILLPRIRPALLHHQLLQRAIETRTPVRRQVTKICVLDIELIEELLLEIRQETEGYALPEVALCNDEEGQTAGGIVRRGVVRGRLDQAVDEELGLVDCFVGGGGMVETREDERDEGAGVGRSGGGVFGEDGGVVGYACTMRC